MTRGILYLEGTTIAPDVAEFLERNQAVVAVPVAGDDLAEVKSVPRSLEANIRRLAEMEREHAAPEICSHLVVYRDEEVLPTAYGAGYGSVYVSKRPSQEQLEQFRRLFRKI